MQYHAKSLSESQKIELVTQIGYEGEQVMIPHSPHIREIRFVPKDYACFERLPMLRTGTISQQFLHGQLN
jgi:hypothetical protein